MSSSTKHALAEALRQMMEIKPIAKITVKDLVEICKVNRQTFYYHFDDVYDLLEWVFEEDADRVLPHEIVYSHWQQDVMIFFQYLYDNASFTLNVYNSDSRLYMLKYLKGRLEACVRSFADIVSEGMNIDKQDYDFVIEFYTNAIIGLMTQCLDLNMQIPKVITEERVLKIMNGSIENMLARFQTTTA
jgi:probable dihydroxyacetone kinase regulator